MVAFDSMSLRTVSAVPELDIQRRTPPPSAQAGVSNGSLQKLNACPVAFRLGLPADRKRHGALIRAGAGVLGDASDL